MISGYVLGGWFLNDLNVRFQLPVINAPNKLDINQSIEKVAFCNGVLVLRGKKNSLAKPHQLTLYAEEKKFVLILESRTADGDVLVRTSKSKFTSGERCEILGESYPSKIVTSDMAYVLSVFMQYLNTDDVSIDLLE